MSVTYWTRSQVALAIAAAALTMAAPVSAQALPDILASGSPYLPDFSYAGYGYGIADIPANAGTIINVGDHGAVPNDGKDDSAGVLAAIAAAKAVDGPVTVRFAAGRYLISEILWIERSDITLSGMGMGEKGTILHMPRPLSQIDDGGALKEIREYLSENHKYERQPDANIDDLFSEYSWSAGFIWVRVPDGRPATYLERYDRPIETLADIASGARATTQLTVADTENLSAGDVVQIHWYNRDGENGALIDAMYGPEAERADLPIGSRHWELPERPLVRQATRIEAIDGNRVTIADPLMIDISAEVPASFARWDHLENVGLQDFAIEFPDNPDFGHHLEAGYNGVYFTAVHNGWIRNLRIDEADSGILTDDLANVTIANVMTTGTHIAHYAVHVGNVHNVLVDNLVVQNPTVHTLSFNTQATRSVYRGGTVFTKPTLDQHAGANMQNLYDAVTVHIDAVPGDDGKPMYDLYKAGGAGYWKPGHARYNTTWNLNIIVDSGAAPDETVTIFAGSEGPDARVIGMHGNRQLKLDFVPAPHVEHMNQALDTAPSLYGWQRRQRITK